MHQIMVVRHNRQLIDLLNPAVTERALNSTTNEAYAALHGHLAVGRITHMQYLALTTALDVILYWMKEPLGSKWVAIPYNSGVAEDDAPVEVDRWSYSKEQRLAYTKDVGAQTAYFEMVEYEVKATRLSPKRYLKILPNGQSTFIEAP